jgi:hypothetical protein
MLDVIWLSAVFALTLIGLLGGKDRMRARVGDFFMLLLACCWLFALVFRDEPFKLLATLFLITSVVVKGVSAASRRL